MALAVVELSMVAALLGLVLDRGVGRAMGALLAVVLLVGAVQRAGVSLLDLLRRALGPCWEGLPSWSASVTSFGLAVGLAGGA
jgi:hypothetical protein